MTRHHFSAAAGTMLVVAGMVVGVPATATQPLGNARVGDEFCEHPSIVGTDDPETLTGTPGRDVVDGLGGDDVIYGLGGGDILCGGGGADTIYAGPGHDLVIPGNLGEGSPSDTDADTAFGGAGRDQFFVSRGADEIHGNRDGDLIQVFEPADGITAFGGAGRDRLDLGNYEPPATGGVAVDVPAGEAAWGDDVVVGFDNMEAYNVTVSYVHPFGGGVAFTGTEDKERLWVYGSTLNDIDMGGGNDNVLVETLARVAQGSRFSGGEGDDRLKLVLRKGQYEFDVTAGLLDVDSLPAAAFDAEHLVAFATGLDSMVFVEGTPEADDIAALATYVRVNGKAGDDLIRAYPHAREPSLIGVAAGPGDDRVHLAWTGVRGSVQQVFGAAGDDVISVARGYRGGRAADLFEGGSGADVIRGGDRGDRMRGGPGPDRLYGGLGDDQANGQEGRDVCVAETRLNCEA